MGCKSAAKSKLKEETVASSSSSLSSLSSPRCKQAIRPPTEQKTIQEQGVERDGKSSLGDEEESEESNTTDSRVSSGRLFPLRESSRTSVIADDSVVAR